MSGHKMMTMVDTKKAVLVGVIFLAFSIESEALACWGVRPLSMGAAFIAVSDDVHSVYWNPAGLSRVKYFELTYTRWLIKRDEGNYDDFLAGAIHLGAGAMGMSFTYNKDRFDRYYIGSSSRIRKEKEDGYVNLGYGVPLNESVSVGLNIKYNKTVINKNGVVKGDRFSNSRSDSVSLLDLGLLWEAAPGLTFGVLGQNINEPAMFNKKLIFNLRPGVAWKPSEKLVFAADFYDLLGKSDGEVNRNIRLGMEDRATENFTLRCGVYHINNIELRAYTAGFGLEIKGWKMDYGFMYWEEAGYVQHMLAFGYKYL